MIEQWNAVTGHLAIAQKNATEFKHALKKLVAENARLQTEAVRAERLAEVLQMIYNKIPGTSSDLGAWQHVSVDFMHDDLKAIEDVLAVVKE